MSIAFIITKNRHVLGYFCFVKNRQQIYGKKQICCYNNLYMIKVNEIIG